MDGQIFCTNKSKFEKSLAKFGSISIRRQHMLQAYSIDQNPIIKHGVLATLQTSQNPYHHNGVGYQFSTDCGSSTEKNFSYQVKDKVRLEHLQNNPIN